MADTEKSRKKKSASKQSVRSDSEAPDSDAAEAAGQASVSDLVLNAGAALGAFDESEAEAGDESDAAEEQAPRSTKGRVKPTMFSKRGKKSKKGKKEKDPIEAVEWNKETSGLDIIESTDGEDGLEKFEELAKQIARTVSSNEEAAMNATGLPESEPSSIDTEVAFDEAILPIEPATEDILAAESIGTDVEQEEVSSEEIPEAASDEPPLTPAELRAGLTPEQAEAFERIAAEAVSGELEGDEESIASKEELAAAERRRGLKLVATPEEEDAIEEAELVSLASEDLRAAFANIPESELAERGLVDDADGSEDGESVEASAEGETTEESMGEPTEEGTTAEAATEGIDEQIEFVEEDRLVSIVESYLFSTDKPVSVATIKQIFKGTNIRSKDITRALERLASEYASATRGVTLEEVHGGYQLRTKVDNSEFLRRLTKVRPFRLSGPALEVMAIVAYKQPITKHEIDEIRGVESGHLLRALMERGLLSFGGKSELPGKPMTYVSTRKFLEIFGLRNLKELPTLSEVDELLPEGIGAEEVEEKETLSDLTDRMSTELTASYSEGEDELEKINEQLKSVDTTTEFFEQEKQREKERKERERAQDIRERLVLGDPVDPKDQRWLDRYETKLQNAAANPEINDPAIGDELSKLTQEAMGAGEETTVAADAIETGDEDGEPPAGASARDIAAEDEEESEDDADLDDFISDEDDLAANPDWNEEDTSNDV